MTAFNTKIAAGVAVFLGVTYLVAGLATGHSARSEQPPDFSLAAADTGLDVWKTAAALLDGTGRAAVLDVRPRSEFARFHLPAAYSVPEASAAQVLELARNHAPLIIVAATDDVAQRLVGEARLATPGAPVHYLVDGPRAWYLAFELPVPLFSKAAPPIGYDRARRTVRASLTQPDPAVRAQGLEALQSLVRLDYRPTLLEQTGKPKAAAGGAKKKISGGCG